MLLYVLSQLWGQINPSGFKSPALVTEQDEILKATSKMGHFMF